MPLFGNHLSFCFIISTGSTYLDNKRGHKKSFFRAETACCCCCCFSFLLMHFLKYFPRPPSEKRNCVTVAIKDPFWCLSVALTLGLCISCLLCVCRPATKKKGCRAALQEDSLNALLDWDAYTSMWYRIRIICIFYSPLICSCLEKKKKGICAIITDNNYISYKRISIKRADVASLPGRLPKKPNRRTNAMGIRLVLAIVVIPVGPLGTFFGQTFPVRKEIPVKLMSYTTSYFISFDSLKFQFPCSELTTTWRKIAYLKCGSIW